MTSRRHRQGVNVSRQLPSTRNSRLTDLLALGTSAMLLATLTACAPDASPAPTESIATPATTSPATVEPSPTPTDTADALEMNCSSVVVDNRFTATDDAPAWGLKEQVAMDGGMVTPIVRTADHGDISITIDRGVSCLASGMGQEAFESWTYVEFDSSQNAALEAWTETFSQTWQTVTPDIKGFLGDPDPRATYSRPFIVIGDGWLAQGAGSRWETALTAFSGELRSVDSNDAVSETAMTLSCSMFFAPYVDGSGKPPTPIYSPGFQHLAPTSGDDFRFVTLPDVSNMPESYANVYCDGILWFEGDPETQVPDEPTSRNDECVLYERGPDSFTAICGAGWAEITAPLEFAAQVLSPKFRGVT